MKVLKLLCVVTVVTAFVLGCATQLHADTINVYIGGGTATFTNTGSGQQIDFNNNALFSFGDTAFGTPLVISPGSGTFLFTSVSGDHGYFAPLSGASFTMGNSTSGIATGSISSIEIIGRTVGASQTSFTVQLTFDNLSFQPCSSSVSCVNSTVLQKLGISTNGTALLSVYFQNTTATDATQLLNLSGSNISSMSGEFDGNVAPEPASLALFGTGLLVVGVKLRRGRKLKQIE